jgi:hypothetical protein
VKIYTTDNYWLTGDAGVPTHLDGAHRGTGVPDGFIGNIAQWCTTCHSALHSDPNSKMGTGGELHYLPRRLRLERKHERGRRERA